MVDKVVDASALAAALFVEPTADLVSERLMGTELHAPAILEFELANICWKKILKHRTREASLRDSLRDYPRLGIKIVPVDPDQAVAVALETGLSAYDSSYLVVAKILGAELVTLDKKLADVARRYVASG